MFTRGARVGLAAVLGFGASVSAQLTGTAVFVTQEFNGPAATTAFGVALYGGPPVMCFDLQAPEQFWVGTTPAPNPPPGFDNSIHCDYSTFHAGLAPFAGTTTRLSLSALEVPPAPGSVRAFNGAGTLIGQGLAGGALVQIEVAINDITAGGAPVMVVAWDNEGGGCYPDCTGEGVLTVADFGCFQTAFVAGSTYADCDLNSLLTVADFGCFQTAFVQGCP